MLINIACACLGNRQIYFGTNEKKGFPIYTERGSNSCSGILLEKITVTQVVKKFPAFYLTRKFITVFTWARHWSLSRAR